MFHYFYNIAICSSHAAKMPEYEIASFAEFILDVQFLNNCPNNFSFPWK